MTTTPIYLATLRHLAGQSPRTIVRTGLRVCPTCNAVGSGRCRTAGGRVARDHVGRAAV